MQCQPRSDTASVSKRRWIPASVSGAAVLALGAALLPPGTATGVNSPSRSPLQADTVYMNGQIITMDRSRPRVRAVAVKGDEIIAVGSTRKALRLAGPKTKVVNLRGKTLVPGFIDAHSHFPFVGSVELFQANLNSPPVGKVENVADLAAQLRTKLDDPAFGEWVLGFGYDQTLLAEGRHPTKEDLDKVSNIQPVWAGHSNGHMGVANTKALELAGITKDTADPPGGTIVKDPETGEPTGLLLETAQRLVQSKMPPLTKEQNFAAAKKNVKMYTAAGVTTSVIAHGSAGGLRDLQEWRNDGILPIRFTQMHSGQLPTYAQQGGMVTGFGDEWLKIGAYGEETYDGSIQGYTGYLKEPYYKLPPEFPDDYRGHSNYTKEDLFERVSTLYEQGYQIAIHANGDQAIEDLLDAYKAAQDEFGKRDARLRIEHAQMATEPQLRRMKKLGVSPSFFVSHTFFWGDQHREIFMGPERAARISPLRSAKKLGIRYSIHLDSPVVPMSPLQAMWSATNRLTRSGKVLGPNQRVSPRQALRAVTIDAAWQDFDADIKGSIEVGKLADFVVLKQNPLTIKETRIRDIKVLRTIVGGKVVYNARRR
jgi:predicted amidohydrolase YtcJ